MEEITATELKQRLDRGDDIQLIDVREQNEYDGRHVRGALHIPFWAIPERADELPRDRPVVFQCRLGARSAMVTEAFRASGWDAYNLEGGITAWVEHGLPIEPQGGKVAEH
jgi:rhodanese-related sulfurtransferase